VYAPYTSAATKSPTSNGEIVAIKLPRPSPGSTARAEFGFPCCCALAEVVDAVVRGPLLAKTEDDEPEAVVALMVVAPAE
jgi:hypothetical protein